jgi:polyisoprenyl-teichoic acid--peptidoglycan teichoic acid transferase
MQKKYPIPFKIFITLAIITLVLSGCSGIGAYLAGSSSAMEINKAQETGTATSISVASTPTPKSTSATTPTPDTDTTTRLPWNEDLMEPEGQIRIALLGSDYRPSSGFRTDVIMIVSINPESKTATVVSLPRDLYVQVPGKGEERINTAFPYGGFELFNATLEENFGFQVDYYVLTNFTGFVNIIDNLGGIDVNSAQSFYDTCDLPNASNGYCSVGVGDVHMDGATALWYARARYTSSDLDRTRRAQEIVLGIFNRLLQFDVITKIPSLYNIYSANVETNLDLATVTKLVPLASSIAQSSNNRSYTVSTDDVTAYTTPSGGAVLLPNYEKIFAILKNALYTP